MLPIGDNVPGRNPPIATWLLILTNGVIFLFELMMPKPALEEERSGGFLRPSASGGRRRGVVLREIVRDLEPRRLRADEDVALRADAGVVVERPHGHHGDVPVAVEARQRRAAAATEDVGEETGLGHFVGGDQLLAAHDAHPVERGEEVRRVGRPARLAAAAAVAVVAAQRRPLDQEGDAAAQAAPARRARPRKRRRYVREIRRLDPGWEGVEARQVVGDVVPWRFGAHEDVSDRSDARVIVERTGGHEGEVLPGWRGVGDDRAAAAAELPEGAGRGLEARDLLGPTQQPGVPGPAHEVGGERGAVQLPAPPAVAMVHELERTVDFPRDVGTEAAATNRHDGPL